MAELFSIAKAIIKPANSTTPIELGVLQEVSIDFNVEKKELLGQNRFALLTVQAGGSVSGKCSYARFNAESFAALLGATKATGTKLVGGGSAQVIPTTPYQLTITPPSSGTFSVDLGVTLVGSSELYNAPMTRVTGTPTTGQYSMSNGVYTFAAADAGKSVIIDYEYTLATGNTITIPNPVIGSSYPFQLWAKTVIESQQTIIKFPNVISGKLSLALKRGEFAMPDFDFDIFADGAGNIGYMYTSF